MKMATRLILLTMALSTIISPAVKLEAYGYQPDGGGYAYVDSGYSVTSSPLLPLAAVSAAVSIGVILYSGNHHHHHHGH
jgi:hypothetical protein